MTTPADTTRIPCVYNRHNYLLSSYSEHVRKQIPEGTALLLDVVECWRTRQVPLADVHIQPIPLP